MVKMLIGGEQTDATATDELEVDRPGDGGRLRDGPGRWRRCRRARRPGGGRRLPRVVEDGRREARRDHP